jgi:hypothetical protein
MNIEILIDERTGQRFKASPTSQAMWWLTPISEPKHNSMVETLSNNLEDCKNELLLEKVKTRMLVKALKIRKVYSKCPQCEEDISAGNEHSGDCVYFNNEHL